MRITYWFNYDINALYASHASLKGFVYYNQHNGQWEYVKDSEPSYHPFFQRDDCYHPIALKDVRSIYPKIKTYKPK